MAPDRIGSLATWVVLAAALGLSALAGCGDDGQDTPFGQADAVRDYRAALNPIIDEVSAIEQEVTARAVDSAQVAVDADLSAVYQEVRPRLSAALADFDRLEPPRRLAELHADIRQLLSLRLEAYQLVMDGYAAGDTSVYPTASAKLRQANALIPDINARLCEVDVALGDRDDCRLMARRETIAARHERG